MSNCFLVADEVGLGKTIVSQHVAEEVFKRENRLHLIYVASNKRIARQNKEDFVPCNFKEPKAFQRETINRVISSFYDGENAIARKQKVSAKFMDDCDRLSMYSPGKDMDQYNWQVMVLSPKTSFYSEDGDEYDGSVNELDFLLKKMNSLYKEMYSLYKELEKWNQGSKKFSDIILNFKQDKLLFSVWYEENLKDMEKNGGKEEDYSVKDLLKKICEIKNEAIYKKSKKGKYTIVGNENFMLLRRIVSNAAFLEYSPNLIIFDEFQKYRGVLCSKGRNHYSISHILEFCKKYKEKTESKINMPKILLLSATPYQYDMSANFLELDPDDKNNGDNPFSSFSDLKGAIKSLGGDITSVENYISRTERGMFFKKEELYEIVRPKETSAHLKYLQAVYCAISDTSNTDTVDRLIVHTPQFWEEGVQNGYKELRMGKKVGFDGKKISKANPMSYSKMQMIKKYGLPKGIQNLLWIPPSSKCYTKYRKSLVFSKYKMTDVVIPRIINRYVDGCINKPNRPDDLKVSSISKDDLKCAIKELLSDEKDLPDEKDLSDKRCEWLSSYLLTDVATKVIKRYCAGKKKEYCVKGILEYCKDYNLKEVIIEYLSCNKLQKMGSVFDYPIDTAFACQFIDDDVPNGKDNNLITQKRFNSPFYPFVLTVTETAQEGLDLHYYCDQIIHWSLPSSVSGFIQREGRIDRPNSLVIRKRKHKLEKEYGDEWLQKCGTPDNGAGLFPDWYISKEDSDLPKIRRVMCGTVLSGEADNDARMIDALDKYNQFLDADSRKELCPFVGKTGE